MTTWRQSCEPAFLERLRRHAQDLSLKLFLNVDAELGLFERYEQPGVILAEDRILRPQRKSSRGCSASLLEARSRVPSSCVVTARHGIRGGESFGSKQRPQTAHCGAGIGQFQDTQLVLHRETAPYRRRSHIGVRSGVHGRWGKRCLCGTRPRASPSSTGLLRALKRRFLIGFQEGCSSLSATLIQERQRVSLLSAQRDYSSQGRA